jgi:uncharacterized membrane protein YfhO
MVHDLAVAKGVSAEPASIVSYDSQRVVIHATLDHAGIVMLTDSNYPGWNAYLDGQPVPILSVNYLFRGVLAPAGSHLIEFRYQPKSYLFGGLISLGACVVILAIAFGSGKGSSAWLLRLRSGRSAGSSHVS